MEKNKTEASAKEQFNYLPVAIILGVLLIISVIAGVALSNAAREAAKDKSALAQEYFNYIVAYEDKTGIPREEITNLNNVPEAKTEEAPEIKEEEEVVKSDEAVEISSEYIYIPEYGIKIKKSESLTSVSYLFSSVRGYGSLRVWAIKKGFQYFPDFADPLMNTSGLYAISIMKRADYDQIETHNDTVAYKDDDVVVSYSAPQATYSRDDTGKTDEMSTTNAIRSWLQTDGTFSRI